MTDKIGLVEKTNEAKNQNSFSQIRKNASVPSMNPTFDNIFFLQKTAGNQAVQRLLNSGSLKAKLRIGRPGDACEQKADRVEEQVMRMPQISGNSEVIQRLESEISSIRGVGKPIPESARAFFEPRFGHDFSQVRVHTDAKAALAAEAVNARAFTVGRDIVFGKGEYAPGTSEGQKLLAHELTHAVQQRAINPYIQRTPVCKNQAQVDERIKENPRSYPSQVVMYSHIIKSGDTLWKLANATKKDNTVIDTGDLEKELKALNSGIDYKTINNCVVLIKNWTSPASVEKSKRTNCDERIEMFKKDGIYKIYSNWERETVHNTDREYKPIVERVAKRRPGLYSGRMNEYAELIKQLNEPVIGQLNEGECVALPVGWIDPNIGKLPVKPTSKILSGDVAKAVATVYAESTITGSEGEKQRKYIWFSIRKRVETAIRGPTLASVLTSEEYNAIGDPNYNTAIEDLKNQTPKLPGVASAKKIVLDNWDNSLPSDAGAFYFHWRDQSSLNHCYNNSKAKTEDDKEKECAWKFAKKNGFVGNITMTQGWLKRIRGASNERFRSMYIYP